MSGSGITTKIKKLLAALAVDRLVALYGRHLKLLKYSSKEASKETDH